MTIAHRVLASPFWPMLRKEFVQMRRDKLTLGLMIGVPAIQLMLFGFAIQTEVRNLPTVVLDESRSSESRALVAAIENTGNFRLRGTVASREEIHRQIVKGEAAAAVIIPPGYADDIKHGRTATAQVIVDAADPLASSAAIGGATQAGHARSEALLGEKNRKVEPPVRISVRPWFNPTLRSSVYIVPGIIGVLLSMTMVVITSVAVVRERERGTLEQLIVTPISRTGLLLGKIVPFVLVGYVQISVILLLGRLVFHVPMLGSLPLLFAVALPFIFASLAIGILLSTMVQTQAQAMQMGFLFLLPNILLSGFMFPREAMPEAAQWLGAALPLTYFLQVLRGVLLKAAGPDAVWRQAFVLTGFALGVAAVAVGRFRKTLE